MVLSILTLLLYFSVFIVAAISISRLTKFRHILGYQGLLIALLGHCFASAAAVAVLSFESVELKILFSRLRFLGFSVISPSIIIFINSLYSQSKWLEKRWVIALLYLPVSITWIITCTPSLQDLMVKDFVPIDVGAFHVLQFRGGAWFLVHIGTSYLYTTIMLVLGAMAFFKADRTKRVQIAVFWISIMLVSLLDILCVITNTEWRWAMLPGAAFVIADIAILYAGLRHKLFEFVPYATEKIFQSLSEPILVFDGDGKLEIANSAALSLFDLSLNRLASPSESAVVQALEGANRVSLKNRDFDVVSEPINSGKGHVSGRIVYLREITAWMELERSLNSHLLLKSTMLSLISHDVVGNLHAQAVLMRNIRTPEDEKTKTLIKVLVDSHETMHQFLRNVLNWEKLHHQKFVLMHAPFDVRIFVSETCEVVSLLANLRSIRVIPHFRSLESPTIQADSEVLGSILRNLLANAIKASRDDAIVEVQIVANAQELLIEVRDSGLGMSKERVQTLMDSSFPTMGLVKTENGGFGLGLSLAKYLTRLHSGKFWIHSELGQGSRVGFSVPLGDRAPIPL